MADPAGSAVNPTVRKKSAATGVNTKVLQKLIQDANESFSGVSTNIAACAHEENKEARQALEDQLIAKLKQAHELSTKIQQEIEKLQHQSEREKKKLTSAIGADFRLTPEEQDIAYELKAKVMRNLHAQSQKIKAELDLHEKSLDLKKAQQLHKKLLEENQLSQTTLVRLNDSYEKRLRKASERIAYLERELSSSQSLVAGYQEAQGATEGEAAGRRHSSPAGLLVKSIRSEDALRKNEILISENEALRREVQRLKADNAELIKKTKFADQEMVEAKHQLITVDASRTELQRRYDKEHKQHLQLQAVLTRQASQTIGMRKQLQQVDDMQRLEQVMPVSPLAARERTFQYSVKRNVDQPRQMLPLHLA